MLRLKTITPVLLLLLATACATALADPQSPTVPQPTSTSQPKVTIVVESAAHREARARKLWDDTITWNASATWYAQIKWDNTVRWNRAAHAVLAVYHPASFVKPATSTYVGPGNLGQVASCIKSAESGNYAESTHTGSGSGAYQFIPGTWRHYFRLWQSEWNADPHHKDNQVPYYDLAYQAPAWVQDAVLNYTVTHGGAHNWDPSYGKDSCTVGLP